MMTTNMKLALFQKALVKVNDMIEQNECWLAPDAMNTHDGGREAKKCLDTLDIYDNAKARIVKKIEMLCVDQGETE
jgi:hypothetical protein